MFVDFKFNTEKVQVRAYWNPVKNAVLKFSVADFHFVKPDLTPNVSLV